MNKMYNTLNKEDINKIIGDQRESWISKQIVAKYGKPLCDIINEYAEQGLTRGEIAGAIMNRANVRFCRNWLNEKIRKYKIDVAVSTHCPDAEARAQQAIALPLREWLSIRRHSEAWRIQTELDILGVHVSRQEIRAWYRKGRKS